MKKLHLIGLLIIALGVAALISIAGQTSTYTDFGYAAKHLGVNRIRS